MHNIPVQRYILTCVVFLFLASTVTGMSRKAPDQAYAPGEVLVRFNDGVDSKRAGEIVHAEGGTVQRVLGHTAVYLVTLPEGADVMEAVKRFSEYPEVRYAEPNFKAEKLRQ